SPQANRLIVDRLDSLVITQWPLRQVLRRTRRKQKLQLDVPFARRIIEFTLLTHVVVDIKAVRTMYVVGYRGRTVHAMQSDLHDIVVSPQRPDHVQHTLPTDEHQRTELVCFGSLPATWMINQLDTLLVKQCGVEYALHGFINAGGL